MDVDGEESHDLLRCEEHFPSSPGFPTSDSYIEYGKTWAYTRCNVAMEENHSELSFWLTFIFSS